MYVHCTYRAKCTKGYKDCRYFHFHLKRDMSDSKRYPLNLYLINQVEEIVVFEIKSTSCCFYRQKYLMLLLQTKVPHVAFTDKSTSCCFYRQKYRKSRTLKYQFILKNCCENLCKLW